MFGFILILIIALSSTEGAWLSQSCQVSEWSAWVSLGNGTSTRARVILRYPAGNGTPCPTLIETKIDCGVSSWTEWKPSANGSSTRTRVITRNPTSNGDPCPPLSETKIDCNVSLWTEWKSSVNGSSMRTRVITQNPTSNGAPCPPLTQTKVDCNVSLWTEWKPSLNGSSTRTRVIIWNPTSNGAPCPPLTETKVDCNVSLWTEWKPSVNGSSTRTRVIIQNPTSNGLPCPPLTETKVDCNVSLWTEWSPSGNGNSTRTRVITRNPTSNGTPCPPLTETRVDCEVSSWTDWHQYQVGQITRTRTVIKKISAQSQCPILAETFNTTIFSTETIKQAAERFTTTFMLGGTVQRRLTKRQTTSTTAKVRDLLIILDGSGSVTQPYFTKTTEQLGILLGLLCPTPNPFNNALPAYQQVALLVFSNDVYEIYKFDSYRNINDIKRSTSNAGFPGASTHTYLAFLQAIKMFTRDKGARVNDINVKKEVLIITDGQSNGPGNARDAARQLKNSGVDVYGLMVGQFDQSGVDEVADFASYPLGDHLFQLKNFTDFSLFVTAVKDAMTANNLLCAHFEGN